jgi:hypothetical protein
MFKKRFIADISLAKTPKNDTELDNEIASEIGTSASNILNGLVEDVLRPTANIIVGSIVTVAVVTAICKIAIKTSPTH